MSDLGFLQTLVIANYKKMKDWINYQQLKKINMNAIAVSHKIKGELDDEYTLYENWELLHEYDKNRYPVGYNLKETLSTDKLSNDVRYR